MADVVGVERGRRLVEEQDARRVHEAADHLEQLPRARGEVADALVRAEREVVRVEQRPDLGAVHVQAHVAAPVEREEDVLGHREVGDERRVLVRGEQSEAARAQR